jgi:hypothetical protein
MRPTIHCEKRLAIFHKLSLAGKNKIIPRQGEFVSDIPAGDRKIVTCFTV